jgi:hypothetical protein
MDPFKMISGTQIAPRSRRATIRLHRLNGRIFGGIFQSDCFFHPQVVNNLDMNSLKFTVWTKAGHEFTASISYSEAAAFLIGRDEFRPTPVDGNTLW